MKYDSILSGLHDRIYVSPDMIAKLDWKTGDKLRMVIEDGRFLIIGRIMTLDEVFKEIGVKKPEIEICFYCAKSLDGDHCEASPDGYHRV